MIKKLVRRLFILVFTVAVVLFLLNSFQSGVTLTEDNYKQEFTKYLLSNVTNIVNGETNLDINNIPVGLVTDVKHISNVSGNFEKKIVILKCDTGNSYKFKFQLDNGGRLIGIKYMQ